MDTIFRLQSNWRLHSWHVSIDQFIHGLFQLYFGIISQNFIICHNLSPVISQLQIRGVFTLAFFPISQKKKSKQHNYDVRIH